MVSLRESSRAARAASVKTSTSIESRCRIVLSSAVTPIAATQSIEEIRILSMTLSVCFIQRLPAGESCLDIVPVFDLILPELPTQVDHPSPAHVWKVAQAAIRVFQQNTHVFDLVNPKHKVRKGFNIFDARLAVPIERRTVPSLLNLGVQFPNMVPFLADLSK